MSAGPTAELARFASELTPERVPAPVLTRVKHLLLDALASAMAGWDSREVGPVAAVLEGLAPGGSATIIGGERTSPAAAAAENGYLVTAVTVCDIHRPSSCHVMPEVLPPALAAAEGEDASGMDLLLALAVGAEVTTRVGLGLRTEAFQQRRWHMPGISGPFGGAAAAGRLLGLDARSLEHALGLAGAQATGSYVQLRTPAIKFQQSRGALAGLLAAYFARSGMRAAEEVLLHPDGGVLRTHSDGGRPEVITDGLGSSWELERISMRPWPVAVHLQPLVTSLLSSLESGEIGEAGVAQARVEMSEQAFAMHGEVRWGDKFLARLSAPFVTGVVLQDRECWLPQFLPERTLDPALTEFVEERVRVVATPELEGSAVRVSLTGFDGRVRHDLRRSGRGDPEDPLSFPELADKFRRAAAGRLGAAPVEEILALLDGLESGGSVRRLTQLLRSGTRFGAEPARG